MIRLALVCCGVLTATPSEARPGPDPAISAYEQARARSGPGSAGEVKLALWCEAHGLTAERMKHLARAVLADPANATARGLLGLLDDGRGRWRRPEEVARLDREREHAALAEYNARRERTAETAGAQWKLALWCEQNGLKAEADAHLTAVTRLDPSRVGAWKHLGYRLHGGRWKSPDRIAAEAAEARAQAKADRLWRPRLERVKGFLAFRGPGRRAEAEAVLAGITDPRAVPSVLAVFGAGKADAWRSAVQILGQIDAPASSRALAGIAVSSPSGTARRAAAETLRRRDPREFVEVLIARLHDPIRYHVKPVGGPGRAGELLIEGDRFTLDRVYTPPPLPELPVTPGSTVDRDADGSLVVWLASAIPSEIAFTQFRPVVTEAMRRSGTLLPRVIGAFLGPNAGLAAVPFRLQGAAGTRFTSSEARSQTAVPIGKMVAEIEKTAYLARGQQRDDVHELERQNALVRRANDPVLVVLADVLGRTPGETRSDLDRWFNDRRGYVLASRSLASRTTVVQEVEPSYTPAPVGQFQYDRQAGYFIPNRDCFAAGTPVNTHEGPRPIESIRVGDRVLAQDPNTGSLSYQPVLAVHHNPPAAVLNMTLGDEAVVTTGIQRFWKAHVGWVMARDLKPGDSLRTLAGVARVASVGADAARPVFNLEVAGGHDFFVGTGGVLVHDHTLVETVSTPFDAAPALALGDRAE